MFVSLAHHPPTTPFDVSQLWATSPLAYMCALHCGTIVSINSALRSDLVCMLAFLSSASFSARMYDNNTLIVCRVGRVRVQWSRDRILYM